MINLYITSHSATLLGITYAAPFCFLPTQCPCCPYPFVVCMPAHQHQRLFSVASAHCAPAPVCVPIACSLPITVPSLQLWPMAGQSQSHPPNFCMQKPSLGHPENLDIIAPPISELYMKKCTYIGLHKDRYRNRLGGPV